MNVRKLTALLDEMDPDSRVVVNICGHLVDIDWVSGEINTVDIQLVSIGQSTPECAAVKAARV